MHRQAVSSVEDDGDELRIDVNSAERGRNLAVNGAAASREEYLGNACTDNIGLALLHSKKPVRRQREQIQAVLRYGMRQVRL